MSETSPITEQANPETELARDRCSPEDLPHDALQTVPRTEPVVQVSEQINAQLENLSVGAGRTQVEEEEEDVVNDSGRLDEGTTPAAATRDHKPERYFEELMEDDEDKELLDVETDENSNAKRIKPNEGEENEIDPVKAEEEPKGSGDDSQNKANSKPPEPPKDYIHVRARRGQATDIHSLAERVRREKINERMKLLQDLVPGCNKVTGKALMLDEIINYVQSLQRQVEFLSMKLASVNTRLDFNMDTLISKDMFQSSQPSPHPIFPSDSSASAAIFGHQQQPNPPLHSNISNGAVTHCSMDPLDTAGLYRNLNTQLPPLDGFTQNAHQYPTFCEDDLQTIVQMGFGQNPSLETFPPQNFQGSNQVSHMKIEL